MVFQIGRPTKNMMIWQRSIWKIDLVQGFLSEMPCVATEGVPMSGCLSLSFSTENFLRGFGYVTDKVLLPCYKKVIPTRGCYRSALVLSRSYCFCSWCTIMLYLIYALIALYFNSIILYRDFISLYIVLYIWIPIQRFRFHYIFTIQIKSLGYVTIIFSFLRILISYRVIVGLDARMVKEPGSLWFHCTNNNPTKRGSAIDGSYSITIMKCGELG